MSDLDRITPYKDGGSTEERIDEIVALKGSVHIEMMDNGSAWMRIGRDIFWIDARKNTLTIRHSETLDPVDSGEKP